HFVIHAPHGLIGRGTDTIAGSRITLHGPGKCSTPGRYRFTVWGSYLTFKRISDPCPRAAVLTAHALRRSCVVRGCEPGYWSQAQPAMVLPDIRQRSTVGGRQCPTPPCRMPGSACSLVP